MDATQAKIVLQTNLAGKKTETNKNKDDGVSNSGSFPRSGYLWTICIHFQYFFISWSEKHSFVTNKTFLNEKKLRNEGQCYKKNWVWKFLLAMSQVKSSQVIENPHNRNTQVPAHAHAKSSEWTARETSKQGSVLSPNSFPLLHEYIWEFWIAHYTRKKEAGLMGY